MSPDAIAPSAVIRRKGAPTHTAAETLLGHNLEVHAGVIRTLTTDRLSNPKFAGPADPQTGIAADWFPTDNTMGDLRCQLTPGMSLSGNEAQLVQRYGFLDEGILQPGRRVRAGETLELELWAKARHRPVPLRFEILPLPCRRPAHAAATITVDAAYWKRYTARLTIPEDDPEAVFCCRLMEEGTVWFDQIHLRPAGEGPFRQELLDRIGALNIPVLRFPGGCMSTNYNWRHGTVPLHLRPTLADPVFKARASYEFGTDEYLAFCFKHGIRPHLTVTLGSGTPEDAADWAAYCAAWYRSRGATPPPAYFQIGNEHYGVHETSHMTGPMYIEALRAFVPPLRAAYPDSRIVALGPIRSAGLRPEFRTPWLAPLLDEAADCFDVLALNRYKGQWNDTPRDRQINAVESVPKIENDLVELIQAVRSRGLPHKVALTEWNYWLHASLWDGQDFKEPDDAQHGCFVAGMLHLFARLGADMELANYYHLVQNMGLFRCEGSRVITSAIADVFALYRPAFPGRYLPLETVSPRLGQTEAALDALALETGKNSWLFLANRDPDAALPVALDGFPGAPAETVLLRAETPQTPLRRAPMEVTGGSLTLPPLSLCRLRWT